MCLANDDQMSPVGDINHYERYCTNHRLIGVNKNVVVALPMQRINLFLSFVSLLMIQLPLPHSLSSEHLQIMGRI
jgi:hypothetical protein